MKRSFLAFATLAVAILVAAPSAVAATITVTTLEDELNSDGDCSLREAVEAANINSPVDACATGTPGPDVITFGVSGAITLISSGLTIIESLTIDGSGTSVTISGGGAVRVFDIATGVNVTLTRLTIADGVADGAGAIFNNGTLSVDDAVVTRNSSTGFGNPSGAIWNNGTLTIHRSTFSFNNSTLGLGGAVGNYGTLTIALSTLSDNSAHLEGGAVWHSFGGGTLTIANSTFSRNSVSSIGGGGAISTAAPSNVTGSVFSENSAGAQGGAIQVGSSATVVADSTFVRNSAGQGGAIQLSNGGTLTVNSSTLSQNSATGSQGGGGIFSGFHNLTVINSTFSGNAAAGSGGGILSVAGGNTVSTSTFSGNSAAVAGGGIYGAFTNLANSVVANSPSGGNCAGSIVDHGGNLTWPDATCPGLNADPLLDPAGLQSNGGPTQTIALMPGSAAIDLAVGCPPPATDQRGVLRPQGAACDSGSYERELTVVRVPQHFQSYDVNHPETVTETVTLVDQFATRTVQLQEIEWLMNPVEKRRTGRDQVPIERPDEHLTCYGMGYLPSANRTVHVRNQFVGDSTLRIARPLALCTPAAKTLTGTPGPPPSDLDHFECYDVTSETPTFRSETLEVRDQFGTRTVRIDRARELCNPVEKRRTGMAVEPVTRPDEHYVCYRIVSHTPAFSALNVFTRDQFDLETFRVVSPRRLCVPSEKFEGAPPS